MHLLKKYLGFALAPLLALFFTFGQYPNSILVLGVILFFLFPLIGRLYHRSKNHLKYFRYQLLLFIICLAILSTGGTASPLFFLIIIILFGISAVISPLSALTSALSTTVAFGLMLNRPITIADTFSLLFLLAITPISVYFGKQQEIINQEKNIIRQQAQDLKICQQKNNLN